MHRDEMAGAVPSEVAPGAADAGRDTLGGAEAERKAPAVTPFARDRGRLTGGT